MTETPAAVCAFWFGAPPLVKREAWFEKDPAFDAEIRGRFAATHDALMRGDLEHWLAAPRSTLAYILVADQFPRNMYRDTPRAFASDARALAAAKAAVWRRWDRALEPLERQFVLMPYMHSESRVIQRRSVELFAELEASAPTRGTLDFAVRHQAIVERFGRFPHRNALLGRIDTPEERRFLREPGSRF